jgi:DNA polymerase III subunit beta
MGQEEERPMRVSCLQEHFARGLSIVQRAVASRSSLPILNNVLISADGPRLRLAGSNLEISINCWIGAKVDEEGATTVPARTLVDFVNGLPPERIDITLDIRTNTLHLLASRSSSDFLGLDAHDFPVIPTPEPAGMLLIDPSVFRKMIVQTTFAAAADESRPILTGVQVKVEGDRVTLAAADGFRLSVRQGKLANPAPEPLTFVLPARALQEVQRIGGEGKNPIEIHMLAARNQVLFHMDDVDLVSQLMDGRFPDLNQFLPKSHTTRTVVNTGELQRAVKLAMVIARDAADVVRLHLTPGVDGAPGKIRLNATAAEVGSSVNEIDASVEGAELEIAFNSRFLNEALGAMDSPQVVMTTTTSSSPGVIRPVGNDDFTHVIMPIHIPR